MLSWKLRFLLAGGTLALATWVGYRAECHVMDAAGSKPVTFQSVVRRVTAPKARNTKIDKLNEIRHRAGRSALSPSEAAAAWETIRGFTAEDVKAYLEEIPLEPSRPANEALLSMLFFRWGKIDPDAAVQVATQPPHSGRQYSLMPVITSWVDRDPGAALRWVAKCDGITQQQVGYAAGRTLVHQDPEAALDKALGEYPLALNGVLAALAGQTGGSAESRRAVLSRLAGNSNRTAVINYLDSVMSFDPRNPERSPDKIAAELDQSGLTDEEIARVKVILDSRKQRLEYEAPDGVRRQQSIDGNLPAGAQQSQYASWAAREPEKAVAWAAGNSRADLVADSLQKQSMNLLKSDWQPGGKEPASQLVKGLGVQYETWRKVDSAAAAAWLQTMPADIRNQLSPADATR